MKARGSGKDQGESVRQQAHHRKTIKIKLLRNSITDMQRRSKQALKISLGGGHGVSMVDTMGQPEDVLRVAGKRWLFRGHIHILLGSPDSDQQVSGGFGLLGDEQCFVPSPGQQSTRDAADISEPRVVRGSVGKQVLFPFGSPHLSSHSSDAKKRTWVLLHLLQDRFRAPAVYISKGTGKKGKKNPVLQGLLCWKGQLLSTCLRKSAKVLSC